MSDYETKKGRLVKTDETVESVIDLYLKQNPDSRELKYFDLPKDNDEFFRDVLSEKYVEYNGVIYEVIQNEDIDNESDIFDLSDNGDGTFDFLLRYYNGGCSFTEALDIAFERKGK